MNLPEETERGIYMPVQVYPMFETALRAAAGRTVDDHQRHLGKLWSDLSHVAAGNEYAWIRDAKSPEEITTVTANNRMIGFPYPKYMNSNNDVDMGAAIIMCSVEAARRLGRARGSLGVPPLRCRLPRAQVRLASRHVRPHAGDRTRRQAGARTRRRRHRRHLDHRPLLVLSGRRAARCRIARARPLTASGRARVDCRSPVARGTTT